MRLFNVNMRSIVSTLYCIYLTQYSTGLVTTYLSSKNVDLPYTIIYTKEESIGRGGGVTTEKGKTRRRKTWGYVNFVC